MSLSSIRSIATSSLTAAQFQMSVTSANVANADTDGYTRKTATQSAVVTGGVGTGVTISAISSDVDKYLLKDLVSAASEFGAADVMAQFTESLQALYGSTTGSSDGGNSLANSLVTLESAISSLAGTPESETLKAQAVSALDDVLGQVRETASGIQGLRADADGGIADAVTTVNDQLKTLADLNAQIAAATARGQPTADLEDQRNTALQAVAAQMDVSYYVNSDNQLRVYTTSGTTLLDTRAHTLSYSEATAVTADTVFSGITVDGKDITGQIGSGTIGGLLTLRDKTLPDSQDALDALAAGLIDGLNAAYNAGSSVPAPASLTGSTKVSATDALSANGTLRIALTDSTGALGSYADLDLSSYATVGDLVSAIDGLNGVSATINSEGRLVIASENGTSGVSLADIGAAVGAKAEGVSSYFGLNDLLTGSGASDIRLRADILADPGKLATGGLSTATSLTTGAKVIGSGESAIAAALGTALGGVTSFAAAGRLAGATESVADYAARIVADAASVASSASTGLTAKETVKQTLADQFASQTGVNLDEETARLSELEQQYSTAAQLLQVLNSMFDALLSAAQST